MKQPDDLTLRTCAPEDPGGYPGGYPGDKRPGPGSAGQSGDDQGLSDVEEAGSESVAELVQEGQYFEAQIISGVENAPDPDVSEVHTKQVPEDDVPFEYDGKDPNLDTD